MTLRALAPQCEHAQVVATWQLDSASHIVSKGNNAALGLNS